MLRKVLSLTQQHLQKKYLQVKPQTYYDLAMGFLFLGQTKPLQRFFPGVENTSTHVLKRFQKQMMKPLALKDIMEKERAVFIELMNEESLSLFKYELIEKMIEAYDTLLKRYSDELYMLREQHYEHPYFECVMMRPYLFPSVAKPLITLATIVRLLQDFVRVMDISQNETINEIKQKVIKVLERKEIKPFIEKETFMDFLAKGIINPYMLLSENQISEMLALAPADDYHRFSEETCVEIKGKSFTIHEKEFQFVHTIMEQNKKDTVFLKAVEEFKILVSEIHDLWEIDRDAHYDYDGIRKEKGKDATKHSFLRQFPNGLLHSAVSKIGFYLGVSQLFTSQGQIYPQLSKDIGELKLINYRNPLAAIKVQESTREQDEDFGGLGAMLGLLGTGSGNAPNITMSDAFQQVTPISIHIKPNTSLVLISGPNMAGKTTTMRGITLAPVINQSILPLTCSRESKLSIFNKIQTLIPDPNQMTEGYGGYAAQVKALVDLIHAVKPGDLVGLDEVPTGTDYLELVAVAVVLMKDLAAKGATVILTGHLKKAFQLLQEQVPNSQAIMHTVMTDEAGTIVPDYGLVDGVAEHSHAIDLAKQVLPATIVRLSQYYYKLITEGVSDLKLLPNTEKLQSYQSVKQKHDFKVPEMVIKIFTELFSYENFVYSENRNQIIKSLSSPYLSSHEEENRDSILIEFSMISTELQNKIHNAIDEFKETGGWSAPKRPSQSKFDKEVFNTYLTWLQKKYSTLLSKIANTGVRSIDRTIAEIKMMQEGMLDKNYFGDKLWNFLVTEGYIDDTERPRATKQCIDQKLILKKDWQKEFEGNEYNKEFLRRIPYVLLGAFNNLEKLKKEYVSINAVDEKDEEHEEHGMARYQQLNHLYHDLRKAVESIIKNLDYDLGKAITYKQNEMKPPTIVEEKGVFRMKDMKPVNPSAGRSGGWYSTEGAFLKGGKPMSFSLDSTNKVAGLLGPNSSGKSILNLTGFVAAWLALKEHWVPGDLEISRFEKVIGHFGGADKTEQGESFFLNILKRLAGIVDDSGENTLLFLDELRGTDHFEMAAIQNAIMHYLKVNGSTALFNTHVRDGLKEVDELVGIDFFKTDFTFDPEKNEVAPKYSVSPDSNLEVKSHGLAVAKPFLTDKQYADVIALYKQLVEESESGKDQVN